MKKIIVVLSSLLLFTGAFVTGMKDFELPEDINLPYEGLWKQVEAYKSNQSSVYPFLVILDDNTIKELALITGLDLTPGSPCYAAWHEKTTETNSSSLLWKTVSGLQTLSREETQKITRTIWNGSKSLKIFIYKNLNLPFDGTWQRTKLTLKSLFLTRTDDNDCRQLAQLDLQTGEWLLKANDGSEQWKDCGWIAHKDPQKVAAFFSKYSCIKYENNQVTIQQIIQQKQSFSWIAQHPYVISGIALCVVALSYLIIQRITNSDDQSELANDQTCNEEDPHTA